MDKMNYPRGLIRYSSENAGNARISLGSMLNLAFRPRVLIYAAFLILLSGAMAWSLAMRVPLKVDVLKDRALAREANDGMIENTYRLQIMNTGERPRTFRISVSGGKGLQIEQAKEITVAGGEIGSQTAVVRAEPGSLPAGATRISFGIADVADPAVAVTEDSKFWMP